MELQLSKSICEALLSNNLINQDTVESYDRFQLIMEDLIASFPKFKCGDQKSVNNIKKRIGKLLGLKARAINVSQQRLKKLKNLVFESINNKLKIKASKRKLKIGKNRQIYSSEESGSQGEGADNEQTGSVEKPINEVADKKKSIGRKKKYKIYDHDFKEQVCQAAIEKGIQHAISKYRLSNRKISSWLEAHKLNLLGKGRKALDPAMQFNMCVWILKKIWNQIPLTQKVIRQKAATMKTIENNFNGSKGWLEKFFLRHVELKSCFDIRSKTQLKQQCARYHRSAFTRLLKDYQTLLQMQAGSNILQGDLSEIIYNKGTHPLLKLQNDKNLDKQRYDELNLYDLDKLKSMPIQNIKLAKNEEIYGEERDEGKEEESQESEEQEQYEDGSSDQADSQESQLRQKLEQDYSEGGNQQMNIYEEDESSEKRAKVKMEQSHI